MESINLFCLFDLLKPSKLSSNKSSKEVKRRENEGPFHDVLSPQRHFIQLRENLHIILLSETPWRTP